MKPFKIGSLVKALLLIVPGYVLGLVAVAFFFWNFTFLWLVFVLSGQIDALPLIAFPIALLLLGFIWYSLVKLIYGFLLRVFWSEPPQLLRVGGIRAGLKTYSEVVLVTLPMAVVFIFLAGFDQLSEVTLEDYVERGYEYTAQKFVIQWLWFWLLSAVGYYHFARK